MVKIDMDKMYSLLDKAGKEKIANEIHRQYVGLADIYIPSEFDKGLKHLFNQPKVISALKEVITGITEFDHIEFHQEKITSRFVYIYLYFKED